MNCSHKNTVWFTHKFCHFSCLQRQGRRNLCSSEDSTPDFTSSPFPGTAGNRDLDQYNVASVGMHSLSIVLSHMVTAHRPMPK